MESAGCPGSSRWATCNKDFWEQWAVRCAGGMPIDG